MSLIIQDGTFGGETNRVCTLSQYYLHRKMNIPFVTGTTTARASAGTSKTITVGAGHGVNPGDFLTVLGLGGSYYNCTQAFHILLVTAKTETTLTYTGSAAETEAETPDTNGRWSCSKWKTLRIGIRFVLTGDISFTDSDLYFGINTGTGKPVTGTDALCAIGWRGSTAIHTWDAAGKKYDSPGTPVPVLYHKSLSTLTTVNTGNFSDSYPGDPAKVSCYFLLFHKKAATGALNINHESADPIYVNMTQAQFKACLGHKSITALSPCITKTPNAFNSVNMWEDPLNGIWDTFEITWGPSTPAMNILDMGWAIVQR